MCRPEPLAYGWRGLSFQELAFFGPDCGFPGAATQQEAAGARFMDASHMVASHKAAELTIRGIRCVGVEVPMTYTLGTSRGRITKAPLLLIDVETEQGVTGRAYLWSYFRQA